MKNPFKSIGFVFLLIILVTCKKDQVTEEEKLTQHEEKIIDKIGEFMPKEVVTTYENSFNDHRTEKDFPLFLDSLEIAIDELKNTIQLNFSIEDFKKALSSAYADINGSTKGSGDGCLGLGYAKGVSVEVGGSGTIGAIVVAGLQSSGGGGVKVVYDFVNLERQIYYYSVCSYGFNIGVGLAAAMNAKLGFSGINEVITGIRYHGSTLGKNSFSGQSIGLGFSIGGEAAAIGSISLSAGFGISKSAYADFEGIANLLPCPQNIVEIVNGKTSYSIKVAGSLSAGAQADIMVLFSGNAIGTNTFGIDNSYTKFHSDRTIAGARMAKEIILTNPIGGIIASLNPIDLSAAAVALIYGQKNFSSCPAVIPSIGTKAINNLTSISAKSGGIIKDDGGSNVTARGAVWSFLSENPTIDSKLGMTIDEQGIGDFTSSITGLTANTKYFVRAYATNSAGTAYGIQVTFTTPSGQGSTVVDLDGNIYKTVTIGTQVWMAENLKTTKYNDGTAIPNLTVNATWAAATTGAYCDYSNTPANSTIYGRLYNWYAVDNNAATKVASNGGKNVCPTGWHVPNDAEWTTLTTYLGGESVAGGKLKETGISHWQTPNTGATNETGFTALPGGCRDSAGAFGGIGGGGGWWSFMAYSASNAYYRLMYSSNSYVGRYSDNKHYGFSVRCLKD